MTDQGHIPDDVEEVGKAFLKNPLTYVAGVVIAGVAAFGISWAFEKWDEVMTGLCASQVMIATQAQELEHERKVNALKLAHATATGNVLREECDAELEVQGEAFGRALSATVESCRTSREECVAASVVTGQ